MRLHGFWRSTATWRVRIALAHKGLAYDYTPVRINQGDQHTAVFEALNPMRHVPVLTLEHEGQTHHVSESLAILELLEELYPEKALLPEGPFARARVRQLALLVVSGIQPLQNTKVQAYVQSEMKQDGKAFARHWVELGLAALETLVRETGAEFCAGSEVSFADVCLVPQLFMARRLGADLAPFRALLAVEERCAKLPAFQKAHAENQPDAER